jgi:bifunctional non-homologous end joining protein LigD
MVMGAPEPMLSTAIRSWPEGGDWMLEPKFDGFRVLIEVANDRRVRAWSRRGTDLTESVGDLLRAFDGVPAGTVIDGELVALTERNGRPAQNFAAVCRAVLNRDSQATGLLQYVAFDLLARGGVDRRGEAWQDRRGHLGEVLPTGDRVRQIDCLPATLASHAAMIELGFEGSVLKRPVSCYRAGRHRSWRKLKARHVARGVLESVRVGRDGQVYGICDVDGRHVAAVASSGARERIGEAVELVYSRVDAEGALREVRLAPAVSSLPT